MTTEIMLVLLGMGGFTTGGLNLMPSACESHEPIDLMHAHIGGMDVFARGQRPTPFVRMAGWPSSYRIVIPVMTVTLELRSKRVPQVLELEQYALSNGEPSLASGRQEMLENLVNDFI